MTLKHSPSRPLPLLFSAVTLPASVLLLYPSISAHLLDSTRFAALDSHPAIARLHYLDASFPGLLPSAASCLIGAHLSHAAVGATRSAFLAKGFKGRDLLKKGAEEIPESLGLPTSILYTLLLTLFIPLKYFARPSNGAGTQHLGLLAAGSGAGTGGWETKDGAGDAERLHLELALYLSTLLSTLSSILLGFLDDVFDIRWRVKFPIPLVSSIPMLMVYFASGGGTSVVVPGWPKVLRTLLGTIVDLGPIYYLFISLLSTFSVHSINILAGLNGVEVGQSFIIAASLAINSVLYLDPRAGQAGSWASLELRDRHLFSLSLLLPFIGVSLGLLRWNRFPALVFVGDTWCYFAGQVLACAGVLGHFSKTLLLFFLPQVFNFVLSCPQLFKVVDCPRHRLPCYDEATNALYPSSVPLEGGAKGLAKLILVVFEKLRLVHLERDAGGRIMSTTNLTLINAILVLCGVVPANSAPRTATERLRGESNGVNCAKGGKSVSPSGPRVTESTLWVLVMLVQVSGSLVAFTVRYWLASIVFP